MGLKADSERLERSRQIARELATISPRSASE
jgi:hypothetical protein